MKRENYLPKEGIIRWNSSNEKMYVLKSKDGSPNFTHFLMHDKGEKTRQPTKSRPTRQKYVVGTGEYIYVSGTPGEMTDALIAAGALYQGVTFNNMRPRVGFGSGFLE